MLCLLLNSLVAVFLLQTATEVQLKPTATAAPPSVSASKVDSKSDLAMQDSKVETRLLHVKRIFVESFGEDSVSKQVQAMVISSLSETKKFIVTENKERADAILKGSSLEKTSAELHSYSDATAAGSAAGGHGGSISGSFVNGTGGISGSSAGGFASHAASIEDSSTSIETVNDARIAVRLVDKDGDVIWATTRESKGAKYKGASADVADGVVKELLRAVERLEKKGTDKTAP